ncbi:MAG TPA: hypothetical protein IGS53_12760 [Leptolyngbyaceae cyanobacterium M33_DOE_097]|uniref:Uncharacterized protein n=1 Tax=Oscillatoriales cyanobacterium SpSt-418 TaxID=2282169 RepID=A0A7C3KGC3_9CYAN|nr:hypothetical protein [Leptolyngbyaceae cyanobacterium M33_DOE_097]
MNADYRPKQTDETSTPDKIGDALDGVADVTDELNEAGEIKTGKMSFWLRLGSILARSIGGLFRKK